MSTGKNSCFALRTDIAIEEFDDGILVFQASDSKLTEINKMTHSVLRYLDGHCSLNDIAGKISEEYDKTQEDILKDIIDVMDSLLSKRIVKPVHRALFAQRKKEMTDKKSEDKSVYLANPDVSCRIEDDDGAILYCADTNVAQIINPIGLEIWETLSAPNSKNDLIEHLKKVCDGIPEDDVHKDVDEFIARLQQGAFVGVVENNVND